MWEAIIINSCLFLIENLLATDVFSRATTLLSEPEQDTRGLREALGQRGEILGVVIAAGSGLRGRTGLAGTRFGLDAVCIHPVFVCQQIAHAGELETGRVVTVKDLGECLRRLRLGVVQEDHAALFRRDLAEGGGYA